MSSIPWKIFRKIQIPAESAVDVKRKKQEKTNEKSEEAGQAAKRQEQGRRTKKQAAKKLKCQDPLSWCLPVRVPSPNPKTHGSSTPIFSISAVDSATHGTFQTIREPQSTNISNPRPVEHNARNQKPRPQNSFESERTNSYSAIASGKQ